MDYNEQVLREKALEEQQTAFIREHGFEIGERVLVDGKLHGVIQTSQPYYGYVAILFKASEYYQVFPQQNDNPVIWVQQMCPVDKLAKASE